MGVQVAGAVGGNGQGQASGARIMYARALCVVLRGLNSRLKAVWGH